jgi:hypothetical protein
MYTQTHTYDTGTKRCLADELSGEDGKDSYASVKQELKAATTVITDCIAKCSKSELDDLGGLIDTLDTIKYRLNQMTSSVVVQKNKRTKKKIEVTTRLTYPGRCQN